MVNDAQINECFGLIKKAFRNNLNRQDYRATMGEGMLLAFLENKGSMTAGELSGISGLGSGRIANLVKATEAKGYVVRRRDEKDGRRVWVTITESGRREMKKREEKLLSHCKEMLELLGEEDTERLLRILHKLTDGKTTEQIF